MGMEETIKNFGKKFNSYRKQNIVIYGCGAYTRRILESYADYNIVALMDPGKEGTFYLGKPVISNSELEKIQVDIVIIVARQCVVRMIFSRISDICNFRGIKVFDINGEEVNYSQDAKVSEESIITSNYIFGRDILGPMTTAFMLWLRDKVMENGFEYILFGARDGYIFHRLYTVMRDLNDSALPESRYIYTSRMCCLSASMNNKDQVLNAAGAPFSGTIEDMLKKRFFLEDKAILPKIKEESDEEYVSKHIEKILDRSHELRSNYKKYLEQFASKSKVAFVDFCSAGTCQLYLEELLGYKMTGCYVRRDLVDDICKKNLNILSMYPAGDCMESGYNFLKLYILLEGIFTSYEGTLMYFDGYAKPVYMEDKRAVDELESIREIQTGIEDYFKAYLSNCSIENIDYIYADKVLGRILSGEVDIDYFKNAIVEDEFVNRKYYIKELLNSIK